MSLKGGWRLGTFIVAVVTLTNAAASLLFIAVSIIYQCRCLEIPRLHSWKHPENVRRKKNSEQTWNNLASCFIFLFSYTTADAEIFILVTDIIVFTCNN